MDKAIIVGLGNPGAEYEHTYHNAGTLALAGVFDVRPAVFKKYKNLFMYATDGDAVFIRPLTYMNGSGKAVREALKKYGEGVEHLLVVHDDSDLPIGDFKISFARSSAGHKGVQSIIDALHTNAFMRIRIGIRPPDEKRRQKAGEFALNTILAKDRKMLESVFEKIRRELEKEAAA